MPTWPTKCKRTSNEFCMQSKYASFLQTRIIGAVCIYAQGETLLGGQLTQHARLLPNLDALWPAHGDGQQDCETIEHKKNYKKNKKQ